MKKQPGEQYRLDVMAPAGTRIGLLAVDQSVYLLSNENRLTKDRVGGLRSRHPERCIEESSLSLASLARVG